LITWEEPNQVLEGHALVIAGGRIGEIGPQAQLESKYSKVERLDAGGQYVMPGNICAHTHFYGAFARGLAIPGPAPKDFPEILQKLWWPLDKSLSPDDVRASALVMLVDAIKNGTTTLIDHHASPNAIEGSLDVIGEAVADAGLRAVLCYEVTDRDGKEKAKAGIAENLRFIRRVTEDKPAGGRLRATFGLHASLTLAAETLQACREAAPGVSGSTSMSPSTRPTSTTACQSLGLAWPTACTSMESWVQIRSSRTPYTSTPGRPACWPRAARGSRTSRART
jgi:cytosine/adenosine deaminase-related metal-dependent hydrolase